MTRPASRRTVLRRAAAAAVPLLVAGGAGCGDGAPEIIEVDDGGEGGPERDVELLDAALDLELVSVAAYRGALPRIGRGRRPAGTAFLEHELEHAERLRRAIRDLGGRPSRPKAVYEVPGLRSERAALEYLAQIERTAIASYLDRLPRLSDPSLRATVGSILTAESEHLGVLLAELGQDPSPEAFVTGAS